MYFDNSIYWMDSSDRGRKRQYAAMLYKHTGVVPTSNGGRTFFEVLPSLAMIRGQVRDHFSWLHSDISNFTIYFNLNNQDHEIARYQIQFEEDGCLKEVLSRELFMALKRVARDFGLWFEMDLSWQFAQRFANDLETIRGAGFNVVISQKRYGT